jgi:hypothetical protein
MVETDGMAERR